VLASIAGLALACLRPPVFACKGDVECVLGERQGQCLGAGFCAYPDDECGSSLRFGPAAGDGMAGECVPEGDTDSDPTLAGSSDGATGCGSCDQPPDPCHLPAGSCERGACVYPLAPPGTDCTDDDPCIHAALCDPTGECVVIDETVCNDPPGACHDPAGVCLGPDRCSYLLRDPGTACEDGIDCTLGDTCNAAGVCEAGDICTSDNLCAVGSCGVTGHCSFFPVTDGTQCGPEPINACCSGACVNLELDEDNCGGCGVSCAGTDHCSTLQPTPTCVPS
jgi:hypothetical protein